MRDKRLHDDGWCTGFDIDGTVLIELAFDQSPSGPAGCGRNGGEGAVFSGSKEPCGRAWSASCGHMAPSTAPYPPDGSILAISPSYCRVMGPVARPRLALANYPPTAPIPIAVVCPASPGKSPTSCDRPYESTGNGVA